MTELDASRQKRPSPSSRTVPVDRRSLAVGDVVAGRYELRRELGRGAGGIVFEAVHRFTGRSVALKVVSTEVPRSQVAEQCARLQREARALAAVRHPGVVDVLDGGLLEDGSPFIALEKLEGRSLEGLLAARGPLSAMDAAAIGVQLCEALDALHAVGIVHRDLKPSNVFLVRDCDGVERVKLLDLGIARAPGAEEENLTGIAALLGTPVYMPPEQLLALPVDFKADLYALGVTLFECLAGRPPYEGSYQSVLLQACAPNARAPRLVDRLPGAAPELSNVLEAAMAAEPGARLASAKSFARALSAAVPDHPKRTCLLGPPPDAQQVPEEQRRNAPRAPYNTPAQLATGGTKLDGRCEDVSEGGMLFICRSSCEAGSVGIVRFALPIEGKVVSCEARVRWVRAARPDDPTGPRAVGIEFIAPSEAVRDSIRRYVSLMSR